MENKFDAKGQVIFIEPTWITGETCLFNVNNSRDYLHAKNKITKVRKEFVNRLINEGFEITYNKFDDRDVVYFIMNDSAIPDLKNEYSFKKEFDKRMFEAGGEKLNYPYSLTMEDYFKAPFLPAVLKNELANGGVDKFLIKTEEQLDIIKKFYNKFYNNQVYREIFEFSIFQQYIETPTNFNTYMRLLMSASGDVMGASLKFSQVCQKKNEIKGMLEKYFFDENSEYFLNSKGMFNYYSFGESISFTQPKYSDIKRRILSSHGINPLCPRIPDEVLEVSTNIATKCNKELGIMCGIDFILNEKDNKWYYLEIQGFPAIDEWAVSKGIKPINVNSVNSYIALLELELEARYEALKLYMQKKLKTQEDEKKLLKN